LGRLRLSVPEAIDKYRLLAKEVFSDRKSPGKDGTFKASKLEKAIEDVIESKLGPGTAQEKMFERENYNHSCKTWAILFSVWALVTNSTIALYVLLPHNISTNSQGYSVPGQHTKIRATIVPFGKLVVPRRLLQLFSSRFR
jgi:hypothetical protein